VTASGRGTAVRGTVAVALAAAALAGCGIRPTTVPVDAGPAPSRAACALRSGAGETQESTSGTSNLRISLVCSSRVVDVERRLELPEGDSARDRLITARTILEELRRRPGREEQKAGFTTAVPGNLRVTGPAEGDDRDALRLNQQPDRLPSFALTQIVCSYSGTGIADPDQQVLLGGPADGKPAKPPRLYECGSALRTAAEAAGTAGEPFRSQRSRFPGGTDTNRAGTALCAAASSPPCSVIVSAAVPSFVSGQRASHCLPGIWCLSAG
jgi:hypothetical protein